MHDPNATTPPLPASRQWVALAVLMLPVLLISLDNTVLGIAVPELSETLQPSASQLLWIVDAYGFMIAGLLITMGNLGDRIGRRRLLLIGAAAFGASSTLAAFSTTSEMLIAARALQGVAGATLMPSTLSLIRTVFDDPVRRRTAIGIWVATFSIGGALGPLAGGWLLNHFWWGSVFLVNLPVMAALLALAPIVLPESRNDAPGRFDLASSLLSLASVLPAIYGLKVLAEHGLSWEVWSGLALSAVATVTFVRRQRRLEDPMLDLDLFAHRAFSVAIGANLLANFAYVGAVFILAQHLQVVVGLDPLAAGFRLVPGMVASGLASLSAAWLMRRGVPGRILVSASLALTGLGYLSLVALDVDAGAAAVVAAMVIVGVGIAITSVVGANVVLAAAPVRRAGSASATSETAFELGAALGIAFLGSALTSTYRRSIDLPTGLASSEVDQATTTIGGAVEVAAGLPTVLGDQVTEAARVAFTSGVNVAGVVGGALLLAGGVVAFVALRGAPTVPTGGDH